MLVKLTREKAIILVGGKKGYEKICYKFLACNKVAYVLKITQQCNWKKNLFDLMRKVLKMRKLFWTFIVQV